MFDKTGTLTRATPQVVEVVPFSGCNERDVLQLAACLEEHFPPSMANPVVRAAKAVSYTHLDVYKRQVADLCAWEQQEHKPVLHLHATGQYGVQLFKDLEKEKNFAEGSSLVVKEYINNMPELLAAADLVISRAGALTLAELEAVGRAAVLIPSPNVAENHQYFNAMELQKAGAAVVIEEKDLTGEKLVGTVADLLAQPGKLAEMGRNARSLSVDDSLDRIAAALMKLVQKH